MKVYVLASSTLKSGGTESMHQLVSRLNDLGIEAYIYYKNPHKNEVIEKFKKYNIIASDDIEDKAENILIVPEIFTGFLKKFAKIKKAIWWLSLDFHFNSTPDKRVRKNLKKRNIPLIFNKPVELLLLLMKLSTVDDYEKLNLLEEGQMYYHLYNCEYIKEYLLENGIPSNKMHYLCGPISDEHFEKNENIIKDKNLVIYNPKKGSEFTNKIIEYSEREKKDIVFFPMENLDEKQIITYQKRAKVYMDFGFFPGPERIPRESVLHYCGIITSKRGAAANEEDVKIPSEYKFSDKEANISSIVHKISEMLEFYEELQQDFDLYREKVILQKRTFNNDIQEVIKLISSEER